MPYPTTPNLGLPLVPDGDQAWGQAMRDAMTAIDNTRKAGAMGRVHIVGITPPLAFGDTAPLDLEFSESCDLVAVTASHDAWVRIYNTSAARTADAGRTVGMDPTPGTGIMGEIYPYAPDALSIHWSPAPLFNNGDAVLGKTAYLAITSMVSGYTGPIDLDFEILPQEYTDPGGPMGPSGLPGHSLLIGSAAPGSSDGQDGDGFFDKTGKNFYGPKDAGAWPVGVSLAGATGEPGSNGSNGAGVPTGGTTGQVLSKNSSIDFDATWQTPSGGGGAQPDYISGLLMTWVSATQIAVTAGAAYIESSTSVLASSSTLTKTPTLAASTMYHLYLFSNAGTPDLDISTTAPAAPYRGSARSKNGDNSRRYLGTFRSNASSQIDQGLCVQDGDASCILVAGFGAYFRAASASTSDSTTWNSFDASSYLYDAVVRVYIDSQHYTPSAQGSLNFQVGVCFNNTPFLHMVSASEYYNSVGGYIHHFYYGGPILMRYPTNSTTFYWFRKTYGGTTGHAIYVDVVRFIYLR